MRKVPAFLLAMLMIVSLFTACNGNTQPSATPEVTNAPAVSGEPADAAPDLSTETILPLVDEKVDLEAYWGYMQSATYFTDLNDMEVIKELERRTNVHVTYSVPAQNAAQEQLNVIFTSGDYPDIFWLQEQTYQGGGDKAIEDGVFLRLNDLIEGFAPNYRNIRENWGDIYRKMTITDYGNIWGMAHVTEGTEPPWTGLVVREDWLGDLGLEKPVTVDDWDNMLKSFRDSKGAAGALILPYNGRFFSSEFASCYGAANGFFQVDGKVKYGYIEPGYKDYLTLMNRWYSEGLIDPDFTSNDWSTIFYAPNADWESGFCGAAAGLWATTADVLVQNGTVTDQNFRLAAVNVPRVDASTPTGIAYQSYPVRGMCAIAADTAYPELCVRWLDYRYTREGAILINYGIEGKSYDMVDGEPVYKKEILDLQPSDPERLTWYISGDTVGLVYYQRMFQGANEEALKAYDVWAKDPTDRVLPKITLTAEEAAASSSKMADIDTYVNENIAMFVTGGKSLDGFDAFAEQIKSMGIDEVIKINQSALDRYNAR